MLARLVLLATFGLVRCGVAFTAEAAMLGLPLDEAKARDYQREWADAKKTPVDLTNSIGLKLKWIPPGRFTLGPNGSTYRVTLTKPFYIGATEVTLGQFRKFKADHRLSEAEEPFNSDDRPTAMVSWEDAKQFCQWLSDLPEERQASRTYALPSESQWEWAARAGTTTTRYFGDDDKRQREFSWFNHTYTPNPKHESGERGRQAVGQLPANAWGLHDMLGNVWEWCDDRRVDERTGETREPVMRGGSWRSGAFHCTAVAHDPGDPRSKGDNIGFRVACMLAE
jgi:formylglycine-generating enzyme required for sulfatase activity